jgi:hypothetical protein
MRRPTALLAAVMTATAALVAIGPGAPAGAAGPTVSVSPAINVAQTGKSFVVKGSGFSATAQGGLGVYVAFGPSPALHPSDWFTDIELYQTAVWVHPGGTGAATNQNMNPDGTFSFTLTKGDGSPLLPAYGSTDCTKIQCGIVTMAAHGSTSRAQDTFRPIIYNDSSPSRAKVGVPYADRVKQPEGGLKPFTFVVTSGTLPPGLTLNPKDGVISGTPTTEGIYLPVVRGTDSTSPTAKQVSRPLKIKVAPEAILIKPANLGAAARNAPLSRALSATGGIGPYTYAVKSGALPPGVTLAPNGAITGTPTQVGTFSFVVRALDSLKFSATRTCTLKIV